ncbi:hypothetical protein AT727_05755 [Desulfitobacterium hafniense]|uniref:Uncharacterized protein n=1 Tax=Desulfitobacterium hafniense TaxID=49338 RepID=A0A0W1JJ90_DESHA|nr:hypothetical protein AT727_05755 [Desulfitobacterium hafniense]
MGEVLIGLYAGSGEEAKIIHWMVSGKGAPFFWVELVAIIVGLVLLFGKANRAGVGVALVAILMIKYNLLQAQLLNPLIPYAGPSGYNPAELGVYIPSLLEVGISVGIVSLGGLLVLIGLNKLNLGNGPKKTLRDQSMAMTRERFEILKVIFLSYECAGSGGSGNPDFLLI